MFFYLAFYIHIGFFAGKYLSLTKSTAVGSIFKILFVYLSQQEAFCN